jgi:hypothetical protein
VHYLAYSETSAIGRAVEHMLTHRVTGHLDRVFVSHLAAVLKTMSGSGRGMAWLPESNIREELEKGALVPAGDAQMVHVPVEIRLFRSREPLARRGRGVLGPAGGRPPSPQPGNNARDASGKAKRHWFIGRARWYLSMTSNPRVTRCFRRSRRNASPCWA